MARWDLAHERANNVMRRDPRVMRVVNRHALIYQNRYRPVFEQRYGMINNWYPHYREVYAPWYRYGFRGGFYYPIRAVYDIDAYFWNATVFWLYADEWDEGYYQTWYGSDYYSNPFLQAPFGHPGVFYPTEELRDLAEAASMLPLREQANFRGGLSSLVDQLQQQLSGQLGNPVMLGRNELVLTHYQLLETAVVLDGFVGADGAQFAFKALIDLEDPSQNLVFVPSGDPSDEQLQTLNAINDRIAADGGIVDVADDSLVNETP